MTPKRHILSTVLPEFRQAHCEACRTIVRIRMHKGDWICGHSETRRAEISKATRIVRGRTPILHVLSDIDETTKTAFCSMHKVRGQIHRKHGEWFCHQNNNARRKQEPTLTSQWGRRDNWGRGYETRPWVDPPNAAARLLAIRCLLPIGWIVSIDYAESGTYAMVCKLTDYAYYTTSKGKKYLAGYKNTKPIKSKLHERFTDEELVAGLRNVLDRAGLSEVAVGLRAPV